MKKLVILLIMVFAMSSCTEKPQENTSDHIFGGLDKSPMDAAWFPVDYKVLDKSVKVVYSRPQLRKRELEMLAPAGKIWRTGANEAAEITFYKDVTFRGEKVKAGTYKFFTIPGETEWTLILNTAKIAWDSYTYKETEDVVRVKGAVSKSETPIEAFSIAFDGEEGNVNMNLGWANTIVTVPIKY
jgi:hypothetical protein